MKNKRSWAIAHMTPVERQMKGLPWYKTKAWEERKLARKIRCLKREKPAVTKALGL